MAGWGEKYVDGQIDRAWIDLRLALADRFEAALALGDMEPIDFTTAAGETLSVNLAEDHVVIVAGDSVVVSDNVDEAAYTVYKVLHDQWQVIHPVFLDSPVVEVPAVQDNPIGGPVPLLGRASSRDVLQHWVVSAFEEACGEPVKVAPNGDIGWLGQSSAAATVSVRDQNWIEVWSVLATEVSFKRARKVIERLSRRYPAVSFSLRRDVLVMSRMVDAGPFVAEHLMDALSMHLDLCQKLAWVREVAARKRVNHERAETVPAELLALLPSAGRVSTSVLAQRLAASADSTLTLESWRRVCRREWHKARQLPAGPDDPERLNHRLRVGWQRLGRAVAVALDSRRDDRDAA